jgi:hypothetical protein
VTSAVNPPHSTSNDWPTLEKKYSKSLTSVNLLTKHSETKLISSPSVTAIPKAVTGGIVERKIERIIEKTSVTEGVSKSKATGANIPRGRNDFKSLSQKWQQISNTETRPIPPPQNNLFVPPSKQFGDKGPLPPPTSKSEAESLSRRSSVGLGVTVAAAAAAEADHAWAERRRAENGRANEPPTPTSSMSSTKRSVSVNDIRKAFEKAEQAVNSYGRDDNDGSMGKVGKDSAAILSPPSAHFRVSSFDSTTSEESSATTPAGIYGSVNSLLSSATRDPYGSITSLASSTSLISPQVITLTNLFGQAHNRREPEHVIPLDTMTRTS